MELRPGYRQTEVGVLPEEWGQATIGDVTTKVGSGITPTGGSSRYKEYGRPFVRSQNIGWGYLLLRDLVFIDEETHNSFPATELKKGDVLLNITGASIGRSALADDRLVGGNVNQHVCIIRSNPSVALPHFINLFLLSATGQRQIDSFQAGGNREGLNFAQIRSIKLPLPPTNTEQEAIAKTLGDVGALIGALDTLIAKKRAIKQGAMQELLTGKRRLPGFEKKGGYKQTKVGMIPEDWGIARIKEICTCFSGGTPSTSNPSYYGGDISWITSSDLNQTRITEVDGRITADGLANSAAKIINEGTLLLALYGATAGICAITRIRAAINQAVLAILPTGQSPEYLFQYLRLKKDYYIKTYTQGGQPNLSGEVVKSFSISLPPTKDEQDAIAAILSDMDAEIAALEQRRDKTRTLKQGMMQELLTGKTRLV